jgi:adenylate cyclase
VGWIVVGIVVLLLLILLPLGARLGYNMIQAYDRRRLARDDNYFFTTYCRTGIMSRVRWVNRWLPSSPRCRVCLLPFGGLGRVMGFKPSRKNPNHCRACFEAAPLGGHDMEVGVLFADIRGFTSWCESQPPEAVAQALNRFYATASAVLTSGDGLIDKLVGDEVMALFLTAFRSHGERTCEVMVDAARELLLRFGQATPDRNPLPVGVGLSYGMARVGNVGLGEVKDFTAVGDVVNTAARLQAKASPGEIVMSASVYQRVAEQAPKATHQMLVLKGKTEPESAYSLRVGSTSGLAPV